MDSMIEQGVGVKAVASLIIKPILAGLIAWGYWPVTDIMLQIDQYVILSPITKLLIQELRDILGVLVAFAVLVKLIIGIVRYKKEKS